MFNTQIISGFPGVGKTYFYKENPDLCIIDSDSSTFSWIEKGIRNPEFPNNYIDHIKSIIGNFSVIFVSSHKAVRDALRANNVAYILAYPDKSLKELYIERYQARGNDENFIKLIEQNWDAFIDEIENESYPTKIKLLQGQFLNGVISRKPHIVSCGGICTSQLDPYCGKHMSNEECPACNSVWQEAHKENVVKQQNALKSI